MACCFLTGVEFRLEDGRVLNRVEAYRLLRTLRNRTESLERLVAQLSPIDKPSVGGPSVIKRARGRRHRMICKAVADALAREHPEVELFLSWTALCDRDVKERLRLLEQHPMYGASIAGLPDEELAPLAALSRQVLGLIDPDRELSYGAQLAIKAGICLRHRTESAAAIASLIRSTILGNGDLVALGVPAEGDDPVRKSLTRVLSASRSSPPDDERN